MCFMPEAKVNLSQMKKLANMLSITGYSVHIQAICNTPYLRWLDGLNKMDWNLIMNVVTAEGIDVDNFNRDIQPLLKQNFSEQVLSCLDVYTVLQTHYQEPVNNAELITSCYLWNYDTSDRRRNEKMIEHFELEKAQLNYAYIAFQCVTGKLYDRSPSFDFFFEAHIPNPKGIDEIYSKPLLGNMREHSKAFLDVKTRLLSFGRVSVIERKDAAYEI